MAFGTAVAVQQTFPEEGTSARLVFERRAYEDGFGTGKVTWKGLENYMRWVFIVSSIGFMTPFAISDSLFWLKRTAIERWLEFNYLTKFVVNHENHVVFRGEYADAARVFMNGLHRTALLGSPTTGDIGLPSVVDETLEEKGTSSFSHGAVSTTSNLEIAYTFGGGGEAVHCIVPERFAPSAQHAVRMPGKEADSPEREFYMSGVDRVTEWLFTVFRNTGFYPGCGFPEYREVVFNPNFSLERMKTLTLDEQVLPIIALLPDADPRKPILLSRVNPVLTQVEVGADGEEKRSYPLERVHDSFYSKDLRAHYERAVNRVEEIEKSGFNGNRVLQGFFSTATRYCDYHGLKEALVRVEASEEKTLDQVFAELFRESHTFGKPRL